jgi:hypothetical protein
MIITQSPNRRSEELIEIVLDVRRHVRDVYVRVIIEKLIMSEVTVLGDSKTWQLGWYLVEKIVRDNPSVNNIVGRFICHIT